MPSLKIVSSAEGVKLLRRNRFDGRFNCVVAHYVDHSAHPNKVMTYHPMFKEINIMKNRITLAPSPWEKRPPWYESILFHTPVSYHTYLWSHTKTVGVSMNGALRLDGIRRNAYTGLLVFAPQPLSAVIYRLYKQVLSAIDSDLEVVIVRTKLDKTVTKYYDYTSQIKTLALNSLFGGYNARRLLKFNGVYLNTRLNINPLNGTLTSDSCRALTKAETKCLNPKKETSNITPVKSGQ